MEDQRMGIWLDGGAAIFALLAAVFWFASAARDLPAMVTYWGGAPPDDPFFASIRSSARLNRWAAFFSGLSALCFSGHFVLLTLLSGYCSVGHRIC